MRHGNLILHRVTVGVPKTRGTNLGVPIIRNIIFGGLYWGPLFWKHHHIRWPLDFFLSGLLKISGFAAAARASWEVQTCRYFATLDLASLVLMTLRKTRVTLHRGKRKKMETHI